MFTTQAVNAAADSSTKYQSSLDGKRAGFGGVQQGKGGHGRLGGGWLASDELAGVLGLSADDVKEALQSGKTLADLASGQGVSVQTVIDAIVKAQTARLDEDLADGKLTQEQYTKRVSALTELATNLINGDWAAMGGPGGVGGSGGLGIPAPDGHGPAGMLGGSEEVASLLGKTTDELREALESGKTLAELAKEQGVATSAVVDLLVKERTEKLAAELADGKLTQEQYDQRVAELSEHATKQVNGELGFGGPGTPDRKGHGPAGMLGGSEEVASLLGKTTDELREALESGKTLAELAKEQGVATSAVVDLLVKERTEKLAAELADGKLTQEQYDQRVAELSEHVTKQVNGERPTLGDKEAGRPEGKPGKGRVSN